MIVQSRAIDRSADRRRLVAVGILALVLTLALSTAVGTGAASPASSPDCPAAPHGWKLPPAVDAQGNPLGKMVVDSGNSNGPGGNRTQVNCNYFGAGGRHVDVVVNFALPTDLNPIADFYFGCSSAITQWSSSERMFVAISHDRWAVVAFSDPAGTLRQADVPGFEQVARGLLHNSEPFAHTCAVKPTPTPVSYEYSYRFTAPGASGSGLLWTRVDSNTLGNTVIKVGEEKFSARVRLGGARQGLTLSVTGGAGYRLARPGSAGELALKVRVDSSTTRSCGVGKVGTLTLTTAPASSVRLALCGQTFLQGPAKVSISSV